MSNSAVLVLNQNYEPLNVCNARRAFVLVDRGKAEILEHAEGAMRSAYSTFPRPSVIRLIYMIRRPRPQMRLTRREIFVRDHFLCQYCGRQTKDLTIDHAMPSHRGGPHAWDHLGRACGGGNPRRRGRPPPGAKMHLLSEPVRPPASSYYIFY